MPDVFTLSSEKLSLSHDPTEIALRLRLFDLGAKFYFQGDIAGPDSTTISTNKFYF